jgi:hypothetical protein
MLMLSLTTARLLFVFVVLTLFSVTAAHAQDEIAVPLEEAEQKGISIAQLDSLHRSAVHSNPDLAVFAGRDQEVIQAWRGLLKALSEHLQANGFDWADPLRGYYRFYFRPEGTIELVLYRVPTLEGEKAAEFGHLLNAFARLYQFDLRAKEGFAQCSPAVLLPPKK